jgi:hypothetical protein
MRCRRDNCRSELALEAEVLRDCFAEIQRVHGVPAVTVGLFKDAPVLRLSGDGSGGACTVDLPRNTDAIVSHWMNPEVDEASVEGYLMPLLEQAFKPLNSSSVVFVRLSKLVSAYQRFDQMIQS